MDYAEQQTRQINEFQARTINAMNPKQKLAWDSLSDFEKKAIVASTYFFAQSYNRLNRHGEISEIAYRNRTEV